jgi:hypothetical protein
VKNKDIEVIDRRGDKHKVRSQAEADDLIMREENAIRSKLRSMGWTDKEIELAVYGDDVSYGLSRILYFCNNNIISALVHRYAFILYGFNVDNNDIARSILTEVIVSELKKQLSDFIIMGDRKDIDAIYDSLNDEIAYPILVDLERCFFKLGRHNRPSKAIGFKVYHTLLLRFVSSDVKYIISSLLRIIHHYTKENVTAGIDRARTEERAELMSRMRHIDEELRSKRKRLPSDKILELEGKKEWNSILEHWFRRDDERESDEIFYEFAQPHQSGSI